MLWIYRLLFLPALLVLSPRYLLRMRKRGGYGAHFSQRFGAHPRRTAHGSEAAPRVWLQAVSVGEMLAIGPLLEGLQQDGVEVYLTTTTSTGFKVANDRYRSLTVGIGYFPVDWWWFSARAWARIAPDLMILTEGERWPEHLFQAARRGVPVMSVNSRLSDRSFARMQRNQAAARLMTRGITRFMPVSAQDAARLAALGVAPECITTTGNIKLDVRIPLLSSEERKQLRGELGLVEPLVMLGSSTWPGEEVALVQAWQTARAAGVRCSLLIVPRHAERRAEIESVLVASGVRFHFRSRGAAPAAVDVAVADTTGELRRLTQLADVVFVGKSLGTHTEGQTPVEAAALGKPILFGPGMSNFRDIARDLMKRGAALEVADEARLNELTLQLLRHEAEREALSLAAAAWHRENSGALARTLDGVRAELLKIREKKKGSVGASPRVA